MLVDSGSGAGECADDGGWSSVHAGWIDGERYGTYSRGDCSL